MCHTTRSVIRKTKRGKSLRYLCKACPRYFSINTHWVDTRAILSDHLDGLSFRKIGRKYGMSPMTTWRICEEELRTLPNNNQFTYTYCSRFSNTFVFDGKYFNIAGEDYDWVLLWGMDYFRIISHHPELVVCDDNTNLKLAARKHFPAVRIQTCFNHFKENIRRDLRVRSEDTYKPFMRRVEDILTDKRSDDAMNRALFPLYREYQYDPVTLSVLTNIQRYREELTGYRGVPGAPVTTNIIEGLNSHLEARLQAIRSFQSVSYAKLWLNGYVLKRRFTRFTDCRGKFRFLNGKSGVQMTKKPEVNLPPLF